MPAMLTTIIPPTNRNLTTLAAVKSRLNIVGNDEDVGLLAMIAEASSEIVGFCGRDLARRKVAETLAGNYVTELLLGAAPVDPTAIAVAMGGNLYEQWSLAGTDPGIINGAWWPLFSYFQGPAATITAEYWAGYTLPDDGLRAADGTPVELLQVAEAAAESATTLTLTAPAGASGFLPAGCGIGAEIASDGGAVRWLALSSDASPDEDLLVVTLADGLPEAFAAGRYVSTSLVYLPEALSAEALRLVQAKRFERTRPSGATSVSAEGVSISWESLEQVRKGMAERIRRWRRRW